MLNLYIDIETVPCQSQELKDKVAKSVKPPKTLKKKESIEAWELNKRAEVVEQKIEKTSLDGAFGELMVFGFAIDKDEPEVLFREDLESSEKELLELFFETATARVRELAGGVVNPPVRIVGHNVANFDIRFIFQRAVTLGVKPPTWFLDAVNSRPGSDFVADTMFMWAGWGKMVSLDTLVSALDLQVKGSEIGDEIDGSMVWEFVQKGLVNEVAEYCKGDVIRVIQAYKKLTFAA